MFTAGQSFGSDVCARLDITDDRVVERNEETVNLSLSADEPRVTIITAGSAIVVINENDNDGNSLQSIACHCSSTTRFVGDLECLCGIA